MTGAGQAAAAGNDPQDGEARRSPTAAALEALGDPSRRAIVEILAAGPRSVQGIADLLPISRPAVSRHLRLLKDAELVVDEPAGAQRRYRLRADGVDAVRRYFEEIWGEAASRYRLVAENVEPRSDG